MTNKNETFSEIAFSTIVELNDDNTTGKVNYNTDQGAEYISRDNRKWDGGDLGTAGDVTFSFLSNAQADSGYEQLSAAQMSVSLQAMEIISSVANITFNAADGGVGNNISDQGEIQFQGYDGGGGGWAGWSMMGGGATYEIIGSTVALGGSSLSLALHEIGHAIALSHPGEYDGAGSNYEDDAEFYQDSEQYSVMSYWSGSKTGAVLGKFVQDEAGNNVYIGGATGLGLFDIAALQRVYGANETTYAADTTYGFNSNTGDAGWTLDGITDWIHAAIWDGGGIDTIDMSGYFEDAVIDLREEAFSSTGGLTYNLAIAKGAVIENAVGGAGNDELRGNDVDNQLNGLAGNDTIIGDGGNDTLFGLSGADILYGNVGNDIASGGEGNDHVYGGSGDDIIFGGDDDDQLFGGDNNDIVSGGNGDDFVYGQAGDDYVFGGAGIDNLIGGTGQDILLGGSQNDIVSGNDGVDQVFGQAGDDSLHGGGGNDLLSGGAGNDQLYSDGGNDELMGAGGDDILHGGLGNDTLTGGAGADDYYFVQGWGADTIQGFSDDVDELYLNEALWGGGLSVEQVLASYGTQSAPGVYTLDFGSDELTIIHGGGINVTALIDDIVLI